jgi:selenocysteine-specific elongation factor
VVTGTLTGGRITVGDTVSLVPGEVEGRDRTARIRGLQSHHDEVTEIEPGNRVAVNLTGVAHTELARGHALVEPGVWHHSAIVDARLDVLPGLDHPVTRRGAYAAYIGSGEFPSRVRVLQGTEIEPGEAGLVRLYLDRPAPLAPGDRFILRESGRNETVGGGALLDVDPVLPASRARPDSSIERLVAERGWVRIEHLARITGRSVEDVTGWLTDPDGPVGSAPVGGWVVDPEARAQVEAEVRAAIDAAGALGLDVAGLDERERAVLDGLEDVAVVAGRATVGEVADPLADHPWVADLAARPFDPPGPDGVDRAEVRELVRRGTVVERDGVFFAQSAIDQATATIGTSLADRPDGLTVAEIRDLLGTTRKYVLPLLAHLDGSGITRRRDDLRIAGPRMPDPST